MKTVKAAYPFPSSRGVTTYQTILYDDGSTSCDCPGWIFQGHNCKHVKILLAGIHRPQPIVPQTTREPVLAPNKKYRRKLRFFLDNPKP